MSECLPAGRVASADIDFERLKRCGFPEVIYAEGKTPEQVAEIAWAMAQAGQPILATRAGWEHGRAVQALLPDAEYRADCQCLVHGVKKVQQEAEVGVVCAGTSDLRVAGECEVSLEFFGLAAELVVDVGVAGLHRLLRKIEQIRRYRVVVVVAGMECALPGVVAGLVSRPVIAVPSSVGYGVGMGGKAALLGALTSCASGVVVVNIDNGFGAACAAFRMLRGMGGQEL